MLFVGAERWSRLKLEGVLLERTYQKATFYWAPRARCTYASQIELLISQDFTQSEDYNKHQGGMKRTFENIEEEVLQSDGFKEICLIFKNANNMIDGQEIDVHQMRCVTLNGESELAPEGVHQDGFDRIGMISIDRDNIKNTFEGYMRELG